jgi:hypothetical protein
MTKKYIGTKEIMAWEALSKDGAQGYAVKYEDGYTSWSPSATFKVAYRVIEGVEQSLTFCDALYLLKRGAKVQRAGWNGKGLWLELQRPDANSKMTLPYIFMSYPAEAITTPGARVPWLASQTDMLAEDWKVV